MSNFFLLNEAIELSNFDEFKLGMSELVAIDKGNEDSFLKHESLWNLNIINTLYSNYGGLEEKVICIFIEQLIGTENYLDSIENFDASFQFENNAFLGINFDGTIISNEKHITDVASYNKFNLDNLWNVTFRNLWKKRLKLFPNLVLCGEVENQILAIGNSGYFNQIIDKLKEFNSAIGNWNTGSFNHREINNNYPLRISPESQGTMNKFGNERIFSLPYGGTEYFEFHIKTGDLRFHFFPNNVTRKVYIGYIGPHLSTISN